MPTRPGAHRNQQDAIRQAISGPARMPLVMADVLPDDPAAGVFQGLANTLAPRAPPIKPGVTARHIQSAPSMELHSSTSIYRAAQQLKAQWVAEGWPAEHLSIVTPPALVLPLDPKNRLGVREKRVYAGLQIKRQVRGELSRVYLRVMHALAKEKGVRFDSLDETDSQLSIPAELQPLSDRLVAGDYSLLPEEEALLKRRYIHTSSNWNNPLGKATGSGIALIYINAPTPDGVRVQHPHVPDYDWTKW